MKLRDIIAHILEPIGFVEKKKLVGVLEIELTGPDGKVKQYLRKENMIVDTGFGATLNSLFATSGRPAIMDHIAIGTDNTAAAAGNAALGAEVARVAATYVKVTDKQATMQSVFGATVGTAALQEAGVCSGSSGGILFDRVVFAVINKGSADSLTVTFTFNLS